MNFKPDQPVLWRDKSFLALMLLHAALLLIFVWFRIIDGDEGIFLRAGQLVSAGQVPYFDFFYMQMPYLPYLTAFFTSTLSGFGGFIAARCVAGGLSWVMALMIGLTSYRFTKNGRLSLIVYAMTVFSGLLLTWGPTVKTLIFSDFFGILSFIILMAFIRGKRERPGNASAWLIVSGVLVGVAINIRLTHVLLLGSELLILWWFWSAPGVKKWLYAGSVLLGVLLASLGSMVLFLKDPSLFWLHNVTVHQRWGADVVSQSWIVRVVTLAKFFAYPQTLILYLPIIFTLRTAWGRPRQQWDNSVRMSMSALLVTMVFAIFFALIMQPVQVQYFEQAVPFLILAGVAGWRVILQGRAWRVWRFPLMAIYVLALIPWLVIFIVNVRENDASNDLVRIRQAAQEIQRHSTETDTLLSANSILSMFARRPMVRGMEVDGRELLRVLPAPARQDLRLLDSLQFVDLAMSGRYPMVIYDSTQFHGLDQDLAGHYRLIASPASLMIWHQRFRVP